MGLTGWESTKYSTNLNCLMVELLRGEFSVKLIGSWVFLPRKMELVNMHMFAVCLPFPASSTIGIS
jgi:hypothetical protein